MNNKIIKTLIPVIAVLVIFESIMLVSSLENNSASLKETVSSSSSSTTKTTDKKETTALSLTFLTETTEMKVGKKYQVSMNLLPASNFNLNALNLFVKFDPTMFTVSDLASGKDLTAKPDFLKVSDKKNVIVANYLFTVKDGVSFVKDKEINVITFSVTPKKAGTSSFEISTGDSEGNSVTMFVDKVTSKALPFSSNKLEVNSKN